MTSWIIAAVGLVLLYRSWRRHERRAREREVAEFGEPLDALSQEW